MTCFLIKKNLRKEKEGDETNKSRRKTERFGNGN